jgi:hypothetical protein
MHNKPGRPNLLNPDFAVGVVTRRSETLGWSDLITFSYPAFNFDV